ncbi:polycystin-2 [Drosophila ficusphila]|uniref:polycystin-2 n=1 Tax=Drosophila ficusphila TaxID=30025 RepID=UPI0007E7AA7E|nr:polycystin-2 [Drosophila ficusphila]
MAQKGSNMVFYLTLIIIFVCGVCIWNYSGFFHEEARFKVILVTFLLVSCLQFLVFAPIEFVIISLDAAWWPVQQAPVLPDENAKVETFMEKLRLKLRTLRSELLITESHRNEKINLKYRLIAGELWLTAKLFLILFGLIMVLNKELLYFNTAATTVLFAEDHEETFGFSSMITLRDLFHFLEFSMIRAFTDGRNTSGGAPWIHAEGTRLVGVVRLRQLRTENNHEGLNPPVFTSRDFMEGWTLPYERVPYTNKFWSIYGPWVAMESDFREDLIMGIRHKGHFISYPETTGYKVLLSDTRRKSLLILDYLYDHRWLDENTSAVFIDFSLYNADANTFSLCTLWVEQFPFHGIEPHIEVESHVLVERLRDLPIFGMVMLFLFVIALVQFAKALIVKIWFEPHLIRTPWLLIDALIVALCLSNMVILCLRANLMLSMVQKVETAVVVEFLDFREPARLSYFADVVTGFTVALVTMRLWKVMQFSGTFQLFTKTLYMAWKAVLWTFTVFAVFIGAIAIAAVTMNGDHTRHFSDLFKGVVSVTCFAFGFVNHVQPTDLFHGGKWMGIVLYAVLGFVVKFLLINLIVSLMRDQMASAKTNRDYEVVHHISFWQFLRVEYADFIHFVLKLLHLQNRYKSHNRTVAENIQRKLDFDQRMGKKQKMRREFFKMIEFHPRDEALNQLRYRERIERTLKISAILQTQMELIERLMFGDEDGKLPSSRQGDQSESKT